MIQMIHITLSPIEYLSRSVATITTNIKQEKYQIHSRYLGTFPFMTIVAGVSTVYDVPLTDMIFE